MYNPTDRAVLEKHVTNVDGNVYCIVNLPEEVIAVIFAYVSRSPRSFRDNLLRLVKEGAVSAADSSAGVSPFKEASERAASFHERWVVGYGHSSVAEHAVAHVGVENISRIASAELELANPYLSFTEYSQRYQKPERGRFFTPASLPPALVSPYQATMDSLYDAYEALYEGLAQYLQQVLPHLADESEKERDSRIAKIAFEDARYALPLATFTNLGLTGNGRALRDVIAQMKASRLPESRELADQIAIEVSRILPTLLRHAEPSPYQLGLATQILAYAPSTSHASPLIHGPEVKLLNYTGQGTPNPEVAAMRLLSAVTRAVEQPGIVPEEALHTSLADLGPHDTLPDAYRWIRYDCHVLLSEAAWHQLLRHMRGMTFQWGPPEIGNGYTLPPNIEAAGLGDVLAQAIQQSEKLFDQLLKDTPELAGYAVTNAHRRRVRAELDLGQLYHLVNLRVSEHAQWDIKDAVTQLWEQIKQVHPNLVAWASRRP